MMKTLLFVALGGSIGAVLRYLISSWVHTRYPASLPWGTLIVNVIGCFIMGWLSQSIAATTWSPAFKLMITTGVLGALTTFSTFSVETLRLWQGDDLGMALLNIVLNVVLSLGAVMTGALMARPSF